MKNSHKGFTLIELLVVVAIIGLLASIVFASLGTARSRGADAAVKGNLSNSRSQAELFADGNGNSYAGVCASINSFVLRAGQATGLASVNAGDGAGNKATCHDSIGGWAAEAPLRASTQTAPLMWCVDSQGFSSSTPTVLGAAADVTCN